MHSKVKLSIRTNLKTFFFQVHPAMTVKEVFQLVSASSLLHKQPHASQEETASPSCVVTQSHDLLLDYLLISTETPISRISYLQDAHIKGSRDSGYNSKQLTLSFCHQKDSTQSGKNLNVEVIYLRKTKKRDYREREVLKYVEAKYQKKSFTEEEPSFSFKSSHEIELKTDGSGFSQRIVIPKDIIGSYADLERLMTIRQRLIKLATHHTPIFGQLEGTTLDEKSFIIYFKYTPQLTLKEVLSSFCQSNKSCLIDKIWFFLKYMRLNGFEEWLLKLVRSHKLGTLLDSVCYGIEGNLKVGDITLTLHENLSFTGKLTTQDEKSLEDQLRLYVSVFSCEKEKEKTLENRQSQADFQKGLLNFDIFAQLFRRRIFTYVQSKTEQHQPSTAFFDWKADQSNQKRICEATTNKKAKRVNLSFRQSKTRKGGEPYLFGTKKNKTKPKIHSKKRDFSYLK